MSFSQQLQTYAQAVVDAVYFNDGSIDPTSCGQVPINGTKPNVAVHQFKAQWNAEGWGSDSSSNANGAQGAPSNAPDPSFAAIGSLGHNGQYDQACAQAVGSVLGTTGPMQSCPPAPGGGTPPGGGQKPTPPTPPGAVTTSHGLSKGVKILLTVIIGLGFAGVGWYLYRRFGRTPEAAEKPRRKKRSKRK